MNKCWFDHIYFNKFVKEEWSSFPVSGKHAFVLKGKFKMLRRDLVGGINRCLVGLTLKLRKLLVN